MSCVDRRRCCVVLPLADGLPARRFPIVNVALITANFAVWVLYELPHLDSSVHQASFYPCSVDAPAPGRSRGR
jgi:rhomboid family protein